MNVGSYLFGCVLAVGFLALSVHSHGHLTSPRSRNWYAHEEGIEGVQQGVPKREYCQHCLNTNSGLCGLSTNWNYDEWIDSTGQPMPWISQATYTAGDTIVVNSYLATHHNGHMELKGCPAGRASTQECLDDPDHLLTFSRDLEFNMPADPNYPERGYYYGGYGGPYKEFSMEFKLPDSLVGEQVLLQWRYITANSCSPPGYSAYFNGQNSQNRILPANFWNSQLGACAPPYPQDGTRSGVFPEQFFNCAEVTIVDASPSSTNRPTRAPVTLAPVVVDNTSSPPVPEPSPQTPTPPAPTPTVGTGNGCCSLDFKNCINWCGEMEDTCGSCDPTQVYAWLDDGPVSDSCMARWDDCTNDSDSCCAGLECVVQSQWYSQCLVPGNANPTGTPTQAPVAFDPSPTKAPVTAPPTQAPDPAAPSNAGCCSHDFKTCVNWCGDTETACNACGTLTNPYHWLTNGEVNSCTARWGDCTGDSHGCCDGLVCFAHSEWYSQCLPGQP